MIPGALQAVPLGTEAKLTTDQQHLVLSVLRFIELKVNALVPQAAGARRDDLVQAGRLGAADAARRFDDAMGTRFLTFAGPHIVGRILDQLRKERREEEIRRVGKIAGSQALRAASAAGRRHLAEEPGDLEVRDAPDALNRERLRESARRLLSAMTAGMATAPSTPEDDVLGAESRRAARRVVSDALGQMSERERAVFTGRYVEGKDLKDVAAETKLGLNTVRRCHEAFLDMVHARLVASEADAETRLGE